MTESDWMPSLKSMEEYNKVTTNTEIDVETFSTKIYIENETKDINATVLDSLNTFTDNDKSEELDSGECTRELGVMKDKTREININNEVISGFVTGNNKVIKISENNLKREMENYIDENDQQIKKEDKNINNDKSSIEPFEVETGFTTGNNKRIKINKNKLDDNKYTININKQQPGDVPIRKYNVPEKGHITTKLRNNIKMMEIFDKCCEKFRKKPQEWIKQQFKWIWLHFTVNPIKYNHTEEEILNVMTLRSKNEISVFKNVLDHSDMAYRYCVLGILKVERDYVELFDGYYSQYAKITPKVYESLKNVTFGQKIHVFGMERTNNEPIDILTTYQSKNDKYLKLNINNYRLCNTHTTLGYKNKISFFQDIKHIQIDGGTIPALKIEIKRIIEEKYLVIVGNYRNRTSDLEGEFEKIHELAQKANRVIKRENVMIKKYTKMIVDDNTEECLFTWWNAPEDIKKGDFYEIVYCVPHRNSTGLHINTTKQTYFKKILMNNK